MTSTPQRPFLLVQTRPEVDAALAEAEVALTKRVVYAGVDGWLEQFTLRPGDVIEVAAGGRLPADGALHAQPSNSRMPEFPY